MPVIFVLSCSFIFSLSALVQKQCLLINPRKEIKRRENVVALLLVHHVQSISEGIFDKKRRILQWCIIILDIVWTCMNFPKKSATRSNAERAWQMTVNKNRQ